MSDPRTVMPGEEPCDPWTANVAYAPTLDAWAAMVRFDGPTLFSPAFPTKAAALAHLDQVLAEYRERMEALGYLVKFPKLKDVGR